MSDAYGTCDAATADRLHKRRAAVRQVLPQYSDAAEPAIEKRRARGSALRTGLLPCCAGGDLPAGGS